MPATKTCEKTFNCVYYKNMEEFMTGVEAAYKSLMGSDYYKQIKIWKKILNEPESLINKSLHMRPEFLKKDDYGKLEGLQQFAEKMSKIDKNTFAELQTKLGILLDTENIINFKFSEAFEYAYEAAREEAGEPEISREELENVVKNEIKYDKFGEVPIENKKFKEKFHEYIKFFVINIILPLALNVLYDLGKAQLGKVIKSSAEDGAPVIYEIHNENTYVNIIDETGKKYRVFFIDNDGNVIDGYIDKESIDMNFEDEED